MLADERDEVGRGADPSVVIAPSAARVEVTSRSDELAPIALSPGMREVFELIDRVATSPISVLLVGETGTGKEVAARAIHDRGPRGDGPMICVNCGAIPEQLVESTLFGHVRGAFTGAAQASSGVFGSADGGTVLLDEIGELPPSAQAALLRVLETKRVTPVGSSSEREVDVRVVAATHRDLEAMCDEGAFRRDLLYRLNAIVIRIPSLRERREEIAPLAARFFAEAVAVNGREIESIAPETVAVLEQYDWPGNLRELKNAIDRAVVIANGTVLRPEDLPRKVRGEHVAPALAADLDDVDLKTRVLHHEAKLIEAALRECDGNQTEAARRLQVPLRTLVHKIKKLGIRR